MTVNAGQRLAQAASALDAALTQARLPHMLIGGLAVIASGYPRTTLDVDATVYIGTADLESVFAALGQHGIMARVPEALEFARRYHVLKLRHSESGTPIDLSVAWLPFEREAIERAVPVTFGDRSVPTVCTEDLIVYKAVAWRERDRSDLDQLLLRHGARIDMKRIRLLIGEFAQVLELPERLGEFDALVRRSRKNS